MIVITNSAQKYLTELLSKQKDGTCIRVSVDNPGSLDAECCMTYCDESSTLSSDEKFVYEGFCIYINAAHISYLKDAKIDVITEGLSVQLILKAPNIKVSEPDKNDPICKRIEYILKTRINPMLAAHGGHVNLINVTADMSAIIQFYGGCNGCSLASLTLKENIERELLNYCPELKEVRDFTDHQRGSHSYY